MPIVQVDVLNQFDDLAYKRDDGVTIRPTFGMFDVVRAGGETYVLGAFTDGLGLAFVEPNGGLSFLGPVGAWYDELEKHRFKVTSVEAMETGGSDIVYVNGPWTIMENGRAVDTGRGVAVLSVGEGGAVSLETTVAPPVPKNFNFETSPFGAQPTVISAYGKTYLVASDAYADRESVFALGADGTPDLLYFEKTSDDGRATRLAASVDGRPFVLTVFPFTESGIEVEKLKENGTLAPAFKTLPDEPSIYNRLVGPSASAEVDGRTFVFVAEATGGTVAAFDMDRKGTLSLVEHQTQVRASHLETFEQEGRTYLAAVNQTTVGIYEISAGGALTEVDRFTPEGTTGIVQGLEAVDLGDTQYLFTAALATDSLRSFRFVPLDERIVGGGRQVAGTEGDDQILAGRGNDVVRAGPGEDMADGGTGRDKVFGEAGDDHLSGGDDNDKLYGGTENDFLFGGGGKDRIWGEDGNDFARGGEGNDRLFGGSGVDRLHGDAGKDTLKGGEGNDSLADGTGRDVLYGEGGQDTFVLVVDRHRDVIADYEDETDLIDLRDAGRKLEFSDLAITQEGDDVLIGYGRDSVLVKAADGELRTFEFSQGDFLFA